MLGTMTTREAFSAVHGRVTLPGDPGWDAARRSWNLSVDQRPVAVVEPTSAADVQAVVRTAACDGLRVAPQATGHGSEALGPLDGAVLLKLSALRAVTAHAGAEVARVEAGARAGEVADAAGTHGLAPVLGLAPTVGVTGLALGGGTGWLSRVHGLTANTVRAFEVVTAAGERLRVDADNEPELFWALRGGGGRFAIVTALEPAVHPVAEAFAGMAVWPAESAPEVLEEFRRWTFEAPEALSPVFRYLSLPPIDAVPAPLRGRKVVAILAAYLGPAADAERVLAPIRGGATLLDTFRPVGPAELVRVAGDPEEPIPARGDGFMLDELPEDAVEALGALIAEDALDPLTVLEVRLLGGALSRTPADPGALARLEGAFSVFAGGAAVDAASEAAIGERTADLRARLAPWKSARELLNSARSGTDPASAFDAATWQRLQRVRDQFDPDRLIQSSHDGVRCAA
jgi:FAD/FMN-containing dehydrogenase